MMKLLALLTVFLLSPLTFKAPIYQNLKLEKVKISLKIRQLILFLNHLIKPSILLRQLLSYQKI